MRSCASNRPPTIRGDPAPPRWNGRCRLRRRSTSSKCCRACGNVRMRGAPDGAALFKEARLNLSVVDHNAIELAPRISEADVSDYIALLKPRVMSLVIFTALVGLVIAPGHVHTGPTIIIFMPLVNALTQAGDINGVHMGVVLIATLAFGLITPPYGLVLLMASKFVGVSFAKALRAALPIYVVFLATIAFTIYFPKVVLWLPKQVIPESVGCFKSPAGTGYICPD